MFTLKYAFAHFEEKSMHLTHFELGSLKELSTSILYSEHILQSCRNTCHYSLHFLLQVLLYTTQLQGMCVLHGHSS